jgi:hypothetical protein
MRVEWAMLANAAEFARTFEIHGGGVNTFVAPTVPRRIEAILVAALSADTHEVGTTPMIDLRIVGSDLEELTMPVDLPMPGPLGPAPQGPAGWRPSSPLIVPFSVTLPTFGAYSLHVRTIEEDFAVPFRLRSPDR